MPDKFPPIATWTPDMPGFGPASCPVCQSVGAAGLMRDHIRTRHPERLDEFPEPARPGAVEDAGTEHRHSISEPDRARFERGERVRCSVCSDYVDPAEYSVGAMTR